MRDDVAACVRQAAEHFDIFTSEQRISLLNHVNSLINDYDCDPLEAFKTIWTFNQLMHEMSEALIDGEGHPDGTLEHERSSFSGKMIATVWCHNIEPMTVKPILSALAIEIQRIYEED